MWSEEENPEGHKKSNTDKNPRKGPTEYKKAHEDHDCSILSVFSLVFSDVVAGPKCKMWSEEENAEGHKRPDTNKKA